MKKPPISINDLKTMACAPLNQHLFPEEIKIKKRSKYNNVKVDFDRHTFDSQKECNVYIGLRMRLIAGEISNLQLQVKYELNEGGTHSYKYIADFVHVENGKIVVTDAKGFRTTVFKKKAKLMLQVWGITVVEV